MPVGLKRPAAARAVTKGAMYVAASFNNTLVTITDEQGQTLCWSSTGKMGFSGSRKSTPFAATVAIEKVLEEAKSWGLRELKVYLKGPGAGRDAALRVLKNQPFKISLLADVTPIAHNGTRPRKKKHNR
ncbi:30S ribosomal protein S11 [Microgenomates group bacterium RBG_16_45_19]|nr:MAG: 30S ribosomal protein S11 [Microgenomates group bacterium RBG_16_45_19]